MQINTRTVFGDVEPTKFDIAPCRGEKEAIFGRGGRWLGSMVGMLMLLWESFGVSQFGSSCKVIGRGWRCLNHTRRLIMCSLCMCFFRQISYFISTKQRSQTKRSSFGRWVLHLLWAQHLVWEWFAVSENKCQKKTSPSHVKSNDGICLLFYRNKHLNANDLNLFFVWEICLP